MLRRIRYFQAVVRSNSFSEAAEECHISQSAISQQIKALETELGFPLLERKNRTFVLTSAGAHFYQKSLILVADYERLCRETARIAQGEKAILKFGCLRGDTGYEISQALSDFAASCPQVSVQLCIGNHEELFGQLRSGGVDLVFNDQRRAFSDEYVNLILAVREMQVEISVQNPLSALPSVTMQDLKQLPCILVASREQQEIERAYYQTVIGLQGEFLFAETLEEARLLVACGRGFLPVRGQAGCCGPSIRRIPLCRRTEALTQTYCLFWKKEHSGDWIEEFADRLKRQFR